MAPLILLASLLLTALSAVAAVPPDELVRNTAEEVLAMVRNDPALAAGDDARLGALVEEKVLGHFDFARMTRLAVGKDWRQADADQQQTLISEFRTLLVRTYSVALAQFHDRTITYLPLKLPADAREAAVHTTITQPSGKPIRMDYRMFAEGDSWKVYDILVDGVSLVINYRSLFNSTVASAGVEGLINLLQDKNAQARQ
jgi:phospholipid transport system substrate-binding protein